MNEYRQITKEEFTRITPALEKCGIQNSLSVSRFVDTKLDKIYDVYLLDSGEKSILKKTSPAEKDMGVYACYFDGHHFAVPKILNSFAVGDDHFVQMKFADGSDARGCSEAEGKRIGKALADIQSYGVCTRLQPVPSHTCLLPSRPICTPELMKQMPFS